MDRQCQNSPRLLSVNINQGEGLVQGKCYISMHCLVLKLVANRIPTVEQSFSSDTINFMGHTMQGSRIVTQSKKACVSKEMLFLCDLALIGPTLIRRRWVLKQQTCSSVHLPLA